VLQGGEYLSEIVRRSSNIPKLDFSQLWTLGQGERDCLRGACVEDSASEAEALEIIADVIGINGSLRPFIYW